MHNFKMRLSISMLTISMVCLLVIWAIYRYQELAIQGIIKKVAFLDASLTDATWHKNGTDLTDSTWVLEHPTLKNYMKMRPLPWSPPTIPDDVREAMDKLNAARVPQDNPQLIQLIRDYYIEPPCLLPYNLKYPNREDFSKGQAPFVDSRLGHMVSKT